MEGTDDDRTYWRQIQIIEQMRTERDEARAKLADLLDAIKENDYPSVSDTEFRDAVAAAVERARGEDA